MNDPAAILQRLTPTGYGWEVELPESYGRLLGRRVSLEICTRPHPMSAAPPGLNHAEVALATIILSRLSTLLIEADLRYRAHELEYPEACGGAYAPWVSISRHEQAERGPGWWALILKSLDGPSDWNIHLEFEKTTFHWIGLAGE